MNSRGWIILVVIAVHVVVVGGLLFMQGCGSPSAGGRKVEAPPPPPMPPARQGPVADGDVTVPRPQKEALASGVATHTVVAGECLSKIAHHYGLTVAELAAINNMKNVNQLRVGQKLVIPASAVKTAGKPVAAPTARSAGAAPKPVAAAAKSGAPAGDSASPARPPKPVAPAAGNGVEVVAGTPYTVQAGDCVSKIAARFGTTGDALMRANGLASDRIRVGQKLMIPDAPPVAGGAVKPEAGTAVGETAAPAPGAPKPGERVAVKPAVHPDDGHVHRATAASPGPAAGSVQRPGAVDPSVKSAAVAGSSPKAASGNEAPKPAPSAADVRYTVNKGEDLFTISLMYGVQVEDLKRVNGLTDTAVKEGTQILIPMGR